MNYMTPYEIMASILLLALLILIGSVLYAINTDAEREKRDFERIYFDDIEDISNE